MRKLKYIANARIPTEKAHGLAIMKMCEAFAEAGVETELLVPKRFNKLKHDPFEYYGVRKIFKIKEIPCLDLTRFGPLGFFIQHLSFAKMATVYSFLYKADLYYGRDEFTLWFISFFRGNVVWEAHTAKNGWLVKKFLKRINHLVVISKGLKEYYSSMDFKSEQILVASSGVDIEMFDRIKATKKALRQELKLPIDKKIVAYIGKLHTMGMSKGTEELENIFKNLTRSDSNILLIIISEALPLEVPKYMKAADILVMNYPNTEHYAKYMSPLKLFEYMASGVLIVTPDLPSIREVLDDSMAYFFESGNEQKLSEAIFRSIDEPNESGEKRDNAHRCAQRFTWENRTQSILDFLK